MGADKEDARLIKFPYCCQACGNEFWMNFYDIMRLTDNPLMPCGCKWQYLDFRRALPEEALPQEDSHE